MATRKLGSTKATDTLLVTSANLATEVTGTLGVANGGTGQTTYTNGQLLIGNTTGNTLGKATITGSFAILVTNGASSITLSPTAVVALTDAATIATDASLGTRFRVTLGGNRTLGNPTNPTDGQQAVWELIQDGTGTRTLALDTKFALGTDITSTTLTTTINKRDFLTAIYNSTADKWYVTGFIKGF